MKTKILSILIIFTLLFTYSCEKKEIVKINPNNIVKPVLSLPSSNILLEEANADDEIIFEWTKADYGTKLAINYTLEIDRKGNDFKKAYQIGVTTKNSLTLAKKDFNNSLLTFGLIEYVENEVEMRVKSSVSEYFDDIISDKKELSVNPYYTEIDYPVLYVPGSYQGWAPSNTETVVFSVNNDEVYEGYLFFPDASTELKFTRVTDWVEEHTIGDPDGSGTSGTLQVGSWGGNNIKISDGAGMHKVIADIADVDNATYTIFLTTWSLFGSATSDADINMTYNETSKLLEITSNLSAGNIIFRANATDELIFGDENGNMKLDAGNYPIEISESGNYTITMNMNKPPYKYSITKN